jgi:ABC-type transport system substrate-binding protein
MLRFFTTLEKVFISVLVFLILATSYYLYGRYIREHSELIPVDGGVYTEGVVGRPAFLNPVLLIGNTVDRDISQLIFSGLTRYNPHTGLIEDDIATSQKSNDNLTYTFTIVPDAKWHDEKPVIADDVLFTYESILQSDEFVNASLKQTFSDVKIKKIDEQTVSFTLQEPNSFFLANVTIGLLPKHQLDFIPVDNLDKSEFNQSPIGSGPYAFDNWSVFNEVHELTLKRNDSFYAVLPKIETVIFRAFPDQASLFLAENTLSGFRIPAGENPDDLFGPTSRFSSFPYHLPQYSALFLNTQSDILSNKKVRFALLLATDKEAIKEEVGDAIIVDTPILESKANLDIEFSLERAMGAFFDTEWNLPSKVKAEQDAEAEAEADEENNTGGPLDPALIQEAKELKFSLEASQDSWISLRTDGSNITSFLLKPGSPKEYIVKDSLTFTTIGNAGGLSVKVNTIPLKSFGGSGVVVRNVSLTRTSLSEYIVDDFELIESEEDTLEEEVIDEVEEEEEDKEEEVVEDDEEEAPETDQVRINDNGDRLILRLVTAQEPEIFLTAAEALQEQWLKAGAKVVIETYSMPELQAKIAERDYDILLFGQNLGYNLDAFPFWHSSQSEDGLNLSEYKSLESDNLLVDIRKTFDERTKQELLDRLKTTIAADTPAVFLYNPTHYYVVDSSVKNVDLSHLSSHQDRFSDLLYWYIKEDYDLTESFSFGELIRWMFSF